MDGQRRANGPGQGAQTFLDLNREMDFIKK